MPIEKIRPEDVFSREIPGATRGVALNDVTRNNNLFSGERASNSSDHAEMYSSEWMSLKKMDNQDNITGMIENLRYGKAGDIEYQKGMQEIQTLRRIFDDTPAGKELSHMKSVAKAMEQRLIQPKEAALRQAQEKFREAEESFHNSDAQVALRQAQEKFREAEEIFYDTKDYKKFHEKNNENKAFEALEAAIDAQQTPEYKAHKLAEENMKKAEDNARSAPEKLELQSAKEKVQKTEQELSTAKKGSNINEKTVEAAWERLQDAAHVYELLQTKDLREKVSRKADEAYDKQDKAQKHAEKSVLSKVYRTDNQKAREKEAKIATEDWKKLDQQQKMLSEKLRKIEKDSRGKTQPRQLDLQQARKAYEESKQAWENSKKMTQDFQ